MDTSQDSSSLALEFQVESTVKSTGETEVIRKRDQFENAWQELADMTLAVEHETDNNNPQKSRGPTEFHTEFHLFSKLPLDIRRMIWGHTVTPRVVGWKNCVLPMEKLHDEDGRYFQLSIPRALCPLNIVSYNGMPAAFWTCYEGRNAVATYYHNIAAMPRDIGLKHENLPIGTLEKYRPSNFSDFYLIDKQTREFESIREDLLSFPLQPSVPFNPDMDIFNFDNIKVISNLQWDHPAEHAFFLRNIPLPAGLQSWRRADEVMREWLIHPWAVKRVQITPKSRFWLYLSHDFSENPILTSSPIIFTNFIFQDLDEFILQDADCTLYHRFDLPINRDNWTSYIEKMLRVEASHNEFAAVRAGSTFKMPKVTILPGAKVSTRCKRCIERQKFLRKQFEKEKRLKYWNKQFNLKMIARSKLLEFRCPDPAA
ncbi:hypothetical protein BTUL_0143g00040 [Botrytis tulipae]|uniref:2EXR domain-containing protein n=1 Tax=Botrytis tulipae TaxID=87230 RepID=A0A4Z1EID6_9HELO|nr:hypothetical protein BTUL_0143g00040 [Botrytis tulipae]